MKIGDIICRKDMPQMQFKIIGENKGWNAWVVMPAMKYEGFNKKEGLIQKNDERWKICRSSKKK
jgi:hypothetical protein